MINNKIDIMLTHRSIRSFTDRAISDEDLDAIIRAVQAAPNWVSLLLVSILPGYSTQKKTAKNPSAHWKLMH